MLDQTELGKGRSLAVYEDLSKGAAYKTRNEKDQYQRPVVTSRGAKSINHKATVTLATCIHGYLDAITRPAVPASLIILEYSLNAIADEQYKTAYTSLEFSKMDSTAAGRHPQIVAWSPHSAKMHSSEVDEKKTRDRKSEGMKLDVMGNGVEIPGSWGSSSEVTAKRKYFQVIQSDKAMPAASGNGYTAVWWSMQQNPDLKDGVPPTLKVAVLVKRDEAAPKAKFEMKFTLRPQATKWDAFRSRSANWWGIVEDDPVLFDPTLPILGGDGIPAESANRLGELCIGEDLKDLGYFRNLSIHEPGSATTSVSQDAIWVISGVFAVLFLLVGLLKLSMS